MNILFLSLAEDLSADADWQAIKNDPAQGDLTSISTLDKEKTLTGRIIAKSPGVIAGLPVAAAVFALVEPEIEFTPHASDREKVLAGQLLARLTGPGPALLAAERCALNFLGRMSGIATMTHQFVEAVQGTPARILDTRKTAPGLRRLDKYSVQAGGGENHRIGLFDMALIKDNHIDGAGGIRTAVERIREIRGEHILIEVEVKDLDELRIALTLPIQRIMLDNMSVETMRQAAHITAGRIPLEASGNVSLSTVRRIAQTGVDYISIGALTHSAPVLDISLRLR
jgi:nicotinate-nucleotide pyrophosphorylase (carboxylating)